MIKETAEKIGSRPREKMESVWISTTFPKKKKFMQVERAEFYPCSVFLVKPKKKENPLDLQRQYVSECHQHAPPPPKVCLGMGK